MSLFLPPIIDFLHYIFDVSIFILGIFRRLALGELGCLEFCMSLLESLYVI
jgi:hypothetical protein